MAEEWIDAEERLPELDKDGKSRPVLIYAGAEEPAQLVREKTTGYLWWRPLDEERSPIPEPHPRGVAKKRWVHRWRPLPGE